MRAAKGNVWVWTGKSFPEQTGKIYPYANVYKSWMEQGYIKEMPIEEAKRLQQAGNDSKLASI